MIDRLRSLLYETDDLLTQMTGAKSEAREEITALRLETCRRRLLSMRNVLALELRDAELDAGKDVLVQVQRDDYTRRSHDHRNNHD